MLNSSQIKEIRRFCAGEAEVALVPTMGALHRGHLSLVEAAREAVGAKGKVVVSIFVNPTQFNNTEDYQHYPNTLEADLKLCEEAGVDLVFLPTPEEMYAPKASVSLREHTLSRGLCGATREGHFDGVCTVVAKLFNIVQPQFAVFGRKDFQQLAIVRKMVSDLNFPVEIIGAPTVRESNGLALSSRNLRLSETARKEATLIYASLNLANEKLRSGGIAIAEVYPYFEAQLSNAKTFSNIDYLELIDAENLQPVDDLTGRMILACAVFFENVRLIDHILIDPIANE